MPVPMQHVVAEMGGGLNDGVIASLIDDNQLASVRNWYPYGKELITRNGISKVTTVSYAEMLTSVFGGKMDSNWEVFVGTLTGLALKDGNALVRIPPADSAGYAASTQPWRMKLYKNTIYAVRRGTGALKRAKTDFMQDAGITASLVAPTLADGGAGALLAGTYFGVVTGYNTQTDAESNPSPPSNGLVLGASKKIDWSGIPTFVNGQVNARRLYRTLLNQQGEYYFVAQINDNFTTTYVGDNFLTASLGRQVSFRNGVPPSGCEHIEIWKERLFLADDTTLFFSEGFLPEAFYALSTIDIYPDDGHKITGLHAFGDRLIIAKTNAIHYIIGTDSSDFTLFTLSDRHGCIAPDSMDSAEGYIFWYEGKNVYRSDGSAVQSISDIKIRALLDRVPDSLKSTVVGKTYPALSQYRLTIPVDDDETSTLTLVYNFRSGAWTVYDGPYGAPSAMGNFKDSNDIQLLYGIFPSKNLIYNLDSGNTDDGVPIQCDYDTKAFPLASDGQLHGLHRVQLLSDADSGVIDLGLLLNMATTAYKTRAGLSLAQESSWKRFNLSNLGKLAQNTQVRVRYSGAPRIKVGGMILEAVAFKRSHQPL